MDTSYDELKAITDNQYEIIARTGRPTTNFHQLVVSLLNRHGIRIRGDDGTDPIATFSISTSRPDTFVVGLRYTKRDRTKTEDHFWFRRNHPVERCYGKKLERLLSEYTDTHKLQR